jgi:hypothetical protein
MVPQVKISDIAIWIKHVENPQLRARLKALPDEEFINLETDGVIGRWVRMKSGKDGRPTEGIRPDGNIKKSGTIGIKPEEANSSRSARCSSQTIIWSMFPSYLSNGTARRMRKHFVICERYETIVVPFPFSDIPILKRRPAVVLSGAAFNHVNQSP